MSTLLGQAGIDIGVTNLLVRIVSELRAKGICFYVGQS
ncbi:hypothetical protein [Marinomonas spartinae]